MRYTVDTEFIELGADRMIQLISIGIVAEDDREYYRQSLDFDVGAASEWVQSNVYPNLCHCSDERAIPDDKFIHIAGGICANGEACYWRHRSEIADEIRSFCDPERFGEPEFWGYYSDYDWVVLCQLFGSMMDLPKGWPMYCHDLKQWCDSLGKPALPEQRYWEHHALADARWNRRVFEFLMNGGTGP